MEPNTKINLNKKISKGYHITKGLTMQILFIITVLTVLIIVTSINPIYKTKKIEIIVCLSMLLLICIISIFDELPVNKIKKIDSTDYYKTYIDTMIDILRNTNKYMNDIRILSVTSDAKFDKYLDRIESAYLYLQTIQPPIRYEEFHADTIDELKQFIDIWTEKNKCTD